MITVSRACFAVTAVVTAVLSAAPALAQTPSPVPGAAAPTTAVLATLTVKADADRSKFPPIMPDEVRDTVRLYLDGKITQWYARGDGRGVVFILGVASVAEAKALMEALPLAKAQLVTFDYMPLTPLTPLRLLLTEPAPKGDRER